MSNLTQQAEFAAYLASGNPLTREAKLWASDLVAEEVLETPQPGDGGELMPVLKAPFPWFRR